MVGDFVGGVDVRDDDPQPTVTVSPASAIVAEGSPLTWTANLSAAAGVPIYVVFTPEAVQPELSTTDVDPTWFTENSGEDPSPSRPLSGTGLQPWLIVEPGTTTATLEVPTVSDDAAEGAEKVRWQASVYNEETGELDPLSTVEGTVTD
jgi:hypothetical protein